MLCNFYLCCFGFALKALFLSSKPQQIAVQNKSSLTILALIKGASALNWLDSKLCGGENMNLLIASAHYNNKYAIHSQEAWTCTESGLKYVLDEIISRSQPLFHVIIHWPNKTRRDTQQNNQRPSISLFALTSTSGLCSVQSNYFPYEGPFRYDSLKIANP